MDLLCGFVPRPSVVAALGRSDFTVSGELVRAPSRNPDGTTLASAHCAVSVPGGGQSPAFSVKVEPFDRAGGDGGIIRAAHSGAADFTYPDSIGIGFASVGGYHDASGKTHTSCDSGLVRGDWTITLGVLVPGSGRNSLDDTVALAQEIIDVLKLPLQPTEPYPPEFSATPAPSSSSS